MTTPIRYGVNIDTFNASHAGADCADAARLGAKWVRVSIEQNFGGRAGPAAMLQSYRTACDNHGLLLMNTCQPFSPAHVVPTSSADLAAYGTYFAEMAAIADLTGIVNEPNLLQHPAPGRTNQAPADWAAVTMACISARDAHAANRQILLAEIADINTNGGVGGDPLAWFKAYVNAQPTMLTAGHVSVGWHGYCVSGQDVTSYWPTSDPNFTPGWNNCKNMEHLYAWLVTQSAGGLTICNTEFGSDSRASNFAQQATDMTSYDAEHQALVTAGATIDCCCWYTLRDHFDPQNAMRGLIFEPPDSQTGDKPAAAAFTTAAGGSTPPGTTISYPWYVAAGAGNISNADIDHWQAIGFKGARVGMIDWDTADPGWTGHFHPSNTAQNNWDAPLHHANQVGFDIILQPGTGSTFGSGGASGSDKSGDMYCTGSNLAPKPGGGTVDVVQKFSAFAVEMAQYYDGNGGRPLVTKFEIFNEVNHARFDDGVKSNVSSTGKGVAYLEYLCRVSVPLRTSRPDLTIISSGLGGQEENPTNRDARLFTQDLFNASFSFGGHTYSMAASSSTPVADRKVLFDLYCWHPYSYYNLPSSDTHDSWHNMVAGQAWLAANGHCDLKLVSTEWGQPISLDPLTNLPDGAHTLADSAAALADAAALWQSYPWAGGGGGIICWFSGLPSNASVTKHKDFGMLAPDYSTRNPLTSKFTAIAATQAANPPPTTTCFAPTSGLPAGGTSLTVKGSFFNGASVTIAGVACTSVVVAADKSSLTCVTPAHAAGNGLPLIVTTPHGSSASLPYKYTGSSPTPPTVTIAGPTTGPLSGITRFAFVMHDVVTPDDQLTGTFAINGVTQAGGLVHTVNNFGFNFYYDADLSNYSGSTVFLVTGTNGANLSTPATETLTVTNNPTDLPPVIGAVLPADGSTLASTVTLQADVTDDQDSTVTVEWWEGIPVPPATYGTNKIATGVQVPGTTTYKKDWDTTTVGDGTRVVHVVATDSAGNVTVSS